MFIFNFITSAKNPKEYQHMIVRSLLVGYVLTIGYHIVPSATGNNEYIDIFLFIIITIILAYFSGRLWISNLLSNIFKKLKISATLNEYLWYDIEDKSDKPLWVRIVIVSQNLDLTGQLVMFEEYQRKPMIILGYYIRKDLEGNTKEDCSNDPTQRVVIDTEKCDRIELVYNKDSVNIK